MIGDKNPRTLDATHATHGIGIEIGDGGMRMIAARADNGERTSTRWHRRLHAPPSPDEALATINDLISDMLAAKNTHQPLDALGIALWGDIDPVRGVMLSVPPAIGWDEYPLEATLTNRWEVPVHMQSAVAAAGLAETIFGAGIGHQVVLYVHSGRTIASALIARGEIVPGASGRAGKLGHWIVRPDGPRCACGQRGHLDPIASAQSIVRTTIGLASGSDESTASMLRVSGGRAEAMTVRQVVQLVNEGDPAARQVLDAAWDALALALANLVVALDPDIIVIGGPPAEAGDAFCEPLRERLSAFLASWRATPTIAPGKLDSHAALLGACRIAVP
ncbi:MAG TPA: ROK family protein [Ktedonobacterales bacterium]|nr:ROK family protein [Ktedonobacterales bacterium]